MQDKTRLEPDRYTEKHIDTRMGLLCTA